tara:strand:- start:601 stop:1365 length:765 start_codon:yes stop_codon:yes gene_type:complete
MINIKKLHEIGLLLKKSLDDLKVFEEIIKVVKKAVEFDYATIFSIKKNNQLELVYCLNDIIVDLASDFNIGDGSGISGWVSNNDNPVIFPDFINENLNRKFNSFVSIPLIIDNNRIGVMNLGHNSAGFYNENDKDNFKILGGQVAIILDKMNLTLKIKKLKSENKNAIKSLKEAKSQLEKNEKLAIIGQSANSIYKEINNPLSVIMGYTDLLINKYKSGKIEPELLNNKLEIILDSARKINTILHHYENIDITK